MTPDIAYTIGYPGQSALKCVLTAIQEVVDRGYVDENAIGIQGHSWGGYQIAYMITRTNRFRAAAAGAPVADMISAYDGIRWGPGIPRQFQYEQTQSRIGGSIWQYPLRFIENSPNLHSGSSQYAAADDSQRCRRRGAVVPGNRILSRAAAVGKRGRIYLSTTASDGLRRRLTYECGQVESLQVEIYCEDRCRWRGLVPE